MSKFATRLREVIKNARLFELLAWCAPALVLAIALRVALTAALPYAFYHDDTTDFIQTGDKLLRQSEIEIHEKKSYLTPLAYSAAMLIARPAMVTIPIAQHLLGIVLVLLIGALCRLWLEKWRIWIIPVTVFVAANPALLWFEHTLMAEPHFVFCIVLLALAATLYTRAQSGGRFAFLCVALFLVTGARPEGKLFFGFGAFLLVLLHFRGWRHHLRRFAIFAVVAAGSWYLARTSQANLLLYTSVAKFTPADLRCAPGFEPYIAPIRQDLLRRWQEMPSFPRVRDRKEISRVVKEYLDARAKAEGRNRRESDERFCLSVAKETCLRNLHLLPGHVLHKYRYHVCDSPALDYSYHNVFEKQHEAMTERHELVCRMSRPLFGVDFSTSEQIERFLYASYREVPWFNTLSDRWYSAAAALRMPDRTYRNPEYPAVPFIYLGIPYYMLAAAAGLLAVMFRRGELRRFHIAWGLSLLGFFFVVMLTANVRARFRFFLEPFWFLYIALLFDCALSCLRRSPRTE